MDATNPATRRAAADSAQPAPGIPSEAVALYTAAAVGGHPALRLKSLIVTRRDGRQEISTRPVIDVAGETVAA